MTETKFSKSHIGDRSASYRRNQEQDDEGTQAQDVASDAIRKEQAYKSLVSDADEAEEPDLVKKQRDMVRTGKIDMGAYAGEKPMDDESE